MNDLSTPSSKSILTRQNPPGSLECCSSTTSPLPQMGKLRCSTLSPTFRYNLDFICFISHPAPHCIVPEGSFISADSRRWSIQNVLISYRNPCPIFPEAASMAHRLSMPLLQHHQAFYSLMCAQALLPRASRPS